MDPFALPCHPDLRVAPEDRDWRAIGVKSVDEVLRKQTRCPRCKTSWTAFQRTFPAGTTVEWVRPTPFRVGAAPVEGGPLWQDAAQGAWTSPALPPDRDRVLTELQAAVAGLGPAWERSAQLCTSSYALAAGGEVVAEPGELLLERREKWNAQDRRLALLWAPRAGRPVVAWHGFSRLLQELPDSARHGRVAACPSTCSPPATAAVRRSCSSTASGPAARPGTRCCPASPPTARS